MKARKGDAVLVVQTSTDFYIGQANRTRTTAEFGMVVSATRDGLVKTWRAIGYGDDTLGAAQSVPSRATVYVLTASEVDVPGLLAAAKEHHWPGHPGQPMPFDSVDDARECARPYRLGQPAVTG